MGRVWGKSNDDYPIISGIGGVVDYIPKTLQLLLRDMFAGKETGNKLTSIGQSIMQAICPRAILAPLQIGLGLQMHHHFASRYLIDTRFLSSDAEVKRFEQNAAVTTVKGITVYTVDRHIQYVAHNVDHNVALIDGTGTFHGMGIIVAVTSKAHIINNIIPNVM